MKRQEPLEANFSHSGHQVVRLLIASYFIGAATGIVPYQSGREMAALMLPEPLATIGFSTFILTTSFLILIGRQTRGAALLLAVFVFWSSYMASFGPFRTLGYQEFWRDLALIGGLILAYADRSAPLDYSVIPRPRRLQRGKITPRRVTVVKPVRPTPTTGMVLTNSRNYSDKKTATEHPAFAENPDDMANLFEQVFEIH